MFRDNVTKLRITKKQSPGARPGDSIADALLRIALRQSLSLSSPARAKRETR
jgi:hypothetical protein